VTSGSAGGLRKSWQDCSESRQVS